METLNENIMEKKIGTKFDYQGTHLIVLPSISCYGCFAHKAFKSCSVRGEVQNDYCMRLNRAGGDCAGGLRSDYRNVIFKELTTAEEAE